MFVIAYLKLFNKSIKVDSINVAETLTVLSTCHGSCHLYLLLSFNANLKGNPHVSGSLGNSMIQNARNDLKNDVEGVHCDQPLHGDDGEE